MLLYLLTGTVIVNIFLLVYLLIRVRKLSQKTMLLSREECIEARAGIQKVMSVFEKTADEKIQAFSDKTAELKEMMDVTDEKILYLHEFSDEVERTIIRRLAGEEHDRTVIK